MTPQNEHAHIRRLQMLLETTTLDNLVAWATSKPATEVIGVKSEPCNCPLYNYLKETYSEFQEVEFTVAHPGAWVGLGRQISEDTYESEYTLYYPEELLSLPRWIDFYACGNYITAEYLLQLLELFRNDDPEIRAPEHIRTSSERYKGDQERWN